MVKEVILSNLNESEIKKKYMLKEFSITLVPLTDNEISIVSNSKINPVSESVSSQNSNNRNSSEQQTNNRNLSTMRKRRLSSARLKSGRKVTQLKHEALVDENTNSSSGSPLYNDVKWEENLVNDTLVDEFAPRVQTNAKRPDVTIFEKNIPENIPVEDDSSFKPGDGVFIHLPTDKWVAATVEEEDSEDEVLVRYHDPPRSEWLQRARLSRVKPGSPPIEKTKMEKEIKVKEEDEVQKLSSIIFPQPPLITQTTTPKIEVTEAITPKIEITESTSPKINLTPATFRKIKIDKNSSDEEEYSPIQGDSSPPSPLVSALIGSSTEAYPPIDLNEKDPLEAQLVALVKSHKPSPIIRTRGGWRRGRGTLRAMHSKSYLNTHSKFTLGEKVLAKWSNQRTQKLPGVIKTIHNDGKCDVLFYDGYEKTINEEDLVKTTEEEVAKYQHMTPSKSENYHNMELDSKEARRQRKKKTFDDYVFARDIKSKRKMKNAERFHSPRKPGYYSKLVEGDVKEAEELEKPARQKRMRKKRKAIFGPKRDTSRGKLHMLDIQRTSPTGDEEFAGFDSEPLAASEAIYKSPPPTLPPISSPPPPPPPPPVVEKNLLPEPIRIDDRWQPDERQEYKPIEVTHEGVVRKSLIVPDNHLPPGWSKHAIVSTANNLWEIILLSPDGYQITNKGELNQYLGGQPPPNLDFHADFNALAKLALKQKESPAALSPSPTPKIWVRKRGGRGGRRGRGYFGGRGRPLGVRTMLPKHRRDLLSSDDLPPPSLPPPPPPVSRCPINGCDKVARNEHLLQMHIKHYHSDLSPMVRSIPNMVDLACARSESVHSDFPKATPLTVKKILPRTFPSPSVTDEYAQRMEQFPNTSPISSVASTSRLPERTLESSSLKRQPTEERRSTIKTMLPLRPSEIKTPMDSDDVESEEDYIEQKKNGSRIFKPGKYRRGSRFLTDAFPDDDKLSTGVEVTEDGVVIERLKTEEYINCVCGFREEDGLMIQCDICMCWQHGLCSGIEHESDVPERYVCHICRNPFRVRSSRRYSFAEHYLTQGKLPRFGFRAHNEDEVDQKERILKRSYELTASIHEVKNLDRSLAAKINIAHKQDHPKLYLWAKNWEESETTHNIKQDPDEDNRGHQSDQTRVQQTGPQPEARIDLDECRLRLLDHIDHVHSQIEERLTTIQTQVTALDSTDPDLSNNSVTDKVTKQTIQMLIRDLETIQKLAAIS